MLISYYRFTYNYYSDFKGRSSDLLRATQQEGSKATGLLPITSLIYPWCLEHLKLTVSDIGHDQPSVLRGKANSGKNHHSPAGHLRAAIINLVLTAQDIFSK